MSTDSLQAHMAMIVCIACIWPWGCIIVYHTVLLLPTKLLVVSIIYAGVMVRDI